MVVDSSAIIAILFREPEREAFLLALSNAKIKLISAASLVEMSIIAQSRANLSELDALLESLRVQIVPFDAEQAYLARAAYRRYGKGNDKASLNFGDCMAYALARKTGQPMLFKGNDFSQTDISSA